MHDTQSAGARLMVQGEYMVFARHADDHAGSLGNDYDIEVAELMSLTGRGKSFVESGIAAYSRLRDLPRLRAPRAAQAYRRPPARHDRPHDVRPPARDRRRHLRPVRRASA